MDRGQFLLRIQNRFKSKFDDREAIQMAKYLFEDLLSMKSDLLMDQDVRLIEGSVHRIMNDEPIQYVTGRADFYGYQFKVDHTVLIPRPETEELVYAVLQYLKANNISNPRILDIGTGSGCIPITLKKEYPSAEIVAIDISKDALHIASQNARKWDVQVDFLYADILNDEAVDTLGNYDVIISNPPYIPHSEMDRMGVSVVCHEPHIALFTEDDQGLLFYQRIGALSLRLLRESGAIFLELNEYHAREIQQMYIELRHVSKSEILKDLQGKDRVLKVTTANK